jgi:hypothetical protein
MRRRWSAPFFAVAGLAAAFAVGGCGNKTVSIHGGETEGIYLNVGQLKYQVEISRQLNPSIPEDQVFLQDVSPADAQLGPDELWFAVFVRVENPTGQQQVPATDFVITDTLGKEYRPVTIGSANPFRYGSTPLPPHGTAPGPDSVAGENTSIGGEELIFRLKRDTLDNRPLEFTIRSTSPPDKATDTLDV